MTTTSHGTNTCTIPDIAIRWVLKYSCDTNSNLAAISNVSRHWRLVACEVINDLLQKTEMSQTLTLRASPLSVSGLSEYRHLSTLLLPEMALEILRRSQSQSQSQSQAATINMNENENEHEHEHEHEAPISINTSTGSFCLAWFPPKGIKIQSVNLNAYSDEELFASDSSGSSVEDENDEMAFYRHRLHQRASTIKSEKSDDDVIQTCSNEWQGYRRPNDVLLPLGYSTTFIGSILQMAADLSSCDDGMMIGSNNNERETTFAVRGAVFARPHLYCLCWDADQAASKLTSKMSNLDLDDSQHKRNSYKLMELKRRKRMHDKMRRTKMKEALPRLISSTKFKNQLLQDPETGILEGRRQRSLQFLNADKTRAVYLRTPPFDCGPVQGPITMFCVGIATEDGCFVSGLNSRYELGHLHGIDEMDKSIDMSPICICAESNESKQRTSGMYGGTIKSYSEDFSDSSGDDYQIKRKGSIYCQCQIQYKNKVNNDSSSEERSQEPEPNQRNIYRGKMGPGRWHCYTAIFNGSESMIRVDGCTEQMNNASVAQSTDGEEPTLDGLTIGSDHCFEMPLCFGEGSDGEGEGSIAELVVFRGAIPVQDIECYERYLMKKHGIVHGQQQIFPLRENSLVGQNIGNQWQEDLWRRQAHALMSHLPNHEVSGTSIPLRVASKHRTVAWQRYNDVTGTNIKVSRIGSRLSNGSSDW